MGVFGSSKKNSIPSIDHSGYNIDGVNLADLGEYKEALKYFNKAIEIEPNNFISYFNRASVKMKLGDIEEARLDFNKSANLDTTDGYYI